MLKFELKLSEHFTSQYLVYSHEGTYICFICEGVTGVGGLKIKDKSDLIREGILWIYY